MNRIAQTLHLSEWRTPCTSYPLAVRGKAEVRRCKYEKGLYPMERINGYEYYQVHDPIPVTELFIRNSCWMVDDPLHWRAMTWYLEEARAGQLLCAGLGLGLMLWLAHVMPKFERVTVIEASEDVLQLILPLLPEDDRFVFINGDFESVQLHNHLHLTPDCILWDLASGSKPETLFQLTRGIAQTSSIYPDTPTMYFGLRSKTGSAYATLDDLAPLP